MDKERIDKILKSLEMKHQHLKYIHASHLSNFERSKLMDIQARSMRADLGALIEAALP